MVDITEISAVVAAAGVLVGVVYYILEIRHQSKTRQMSLLMNLYLTWGSEDMKKALGRWVGQGYVKDYEDFVKKHGSQFPATGQRSQVWEDIDRIGWFFNGIGFLVHEKFVDVSLVDRLFGYGVIDEWERMKVLVYGWRKQYSVPKSFGWFEYLANEMQKREQQPTKIG